MQVYRGLKNVFGMAANEAPYFEVPASVAYRLDDHTGKFTEEVKLPFRVVSLIREP